MRPLTPLSGFGHSGYSGQAHFGGPEYRLTSDEGNLFFRLWQDANRPHVLQRTSVQTAIRRLSYAAERVTFEDKLIDLLICAEALFLSEQTDWHGEITYRLSHRAAMFLQAKPEDRRTAFEFFREAYGVRSKIVHGAPHPRLPIKQGTTRFSFPEFLSVLEGHMRQAITSSISLAARKSAKEFGDVSFAWLMFLPVKAYATTHLRLEPTTSGSLRYFVKTR
jgi:hypothetical protein